eukprot:793114_1
MNAHQALSAAFSNSKFCDARFLIHSEGDEFEDVEIVGIRSVLAANSEVFEAMFYGSMMESKTKNVIDIIDCPAEAFQIMMQYMHGNVIKNLPIDNVIDVLCVADRYQVEYLSTHCTDFIRNHISETSVCSVLSKVFGKFDKISNMCMDLLAKHAWKIFEYN